MESGLQNFLWEWDRDSSVSRRGETRYSLKLLPIGGSCAMVGEDTDEEELPGSFNAASVGGRISVVAAGPVFNFILAFVLAVIIVGFVGYDPSEVGGRERITCSGSGS